MRGVVAAVAGALMFGFGANAMADSTTDIVNALVAKGVLTEEEGALLNKGREGEAAGQAKALKKAGKVSISDAIDSAKIYGDYRARYEYRSAKDDTSEIERQRARGKVTFGVTTESGKAYSDFALVLGAAGRTDNFTFGSNTSSGTESQVKQGVYLKRAMFGYNLTPWATVEAGIMNNPLYTTSMVWDADLSVGGFVEKFKYKTEGGIDLFANVVQDFMAGDHKLTTTNATGATASTHVGEMYATQIGAAFPLMENKATAKVAATYYMYGGGTKLKGTFAPALNSTVFASLATNGAGLNDLDILEIPAEVNFMVAENVGFRVLGDYVHNFSGSDRAKNAGVVDSANAAVYAANVDDTSWLLGVAVGSAKDLKTFESNKMKAGDWKVTGWYQSMGAFAQDPTANDSDLFDSRLNTEGWVLKAQYNIEDNIALNVAYADASRKNNALGTVYASGNDIDKNWNDFQLFQFDVTYKY